MNETIRKFKIRVTPKKTADGRSFLTFKTFSKNGRAIEVKFNKDVVIKRFEVISERIIFEGTLFDQLYKFAIYNDENVKNELLKYINFEGEQK